jgi:uncharacterized protein (UPF0218 family)
MANIKYILPDHLRKKLKEPFGILVNEQELLLTLKNEKYIVSVGDQVTYTLLINSIKPIFCIIDYKTKRNNCENEIKNLITKFGKKIVKIKNPPRVITEELWETIKSAYKKLEIESYRIEIDGEEDLAALPAILLAPRDVTIIYGLPNKGVVIVKAIDKNKKKVQKILDKM